MMLSPHFSLQEFTTSQEAQRRGIDNTPTPDVLERLKHTALGLEAIRIRLGRPIHITSGFRCLALNRALRSRDTSQHVLGEAADFICPGFGSPQTVCDALIDSGIAFDQLILEYPPSGWVHVSFSGQGRREALLIDHSGTRPLCA